MKNPPVKFGLIFGLVMGVFFLGSTTFTSFNMDYYLAEVVGRATIFILVGLSLTLALLEIRKKSFPEPITFRKIFFSGLIVIGIAALFTAIGTYLLYAVVDPTISDTFLDQAVASMKNKGAPQAEIDAMIAQVESFPEFFFTPIGGVIFMIFEVLFWGLPAILVVSLIFWLKTKNKKDTPVPAAIN